MVTRAIRRLGQLVGVDGDDAKVIAVAFAVVVVLGIMMIMVGAFLGAALMVFDCMRSL